MLEASPCGHTVCRSLDLWYLSLPDLSSDLKGRKRSPIRRTMRNASREDFTLWQRRASAHVPMSCEDTLYRTGHWPQRALLAGPLAVCPEGCTHVCVRRLLVVHSKCQESQILQLTPQYHSLSPGTGSLHPHPKLCLWPSPWQGCPGGFPVPLAGDVPCFCSPDHHTPERCYYGNRALESSPQDSGCSQLYS